MIKFDHTSSGHKRSSCSSCGRAVVRQPYMTNYQWAAALIEFRSSHKNCGKAKRAYLAILSYNDAQERGAEQCENCGNTDPWFPRCTEHEPIG